MISAAQEAALSAAHAAGENAHKASIKASVNPKTARRWYLYFEGKIDRPEDFSNPSNHRGFTDMPTYTGPDWIGEPCTKAAQVLSRQARASRARPSSRRGRAAVR